MQTNVSLYSTAVSYGILGTATAPVPACPQPTRGRMFGLWMAVSYAMRSDCLHGHNQRVAWPQALAGGRSARQATTQVRIDATGTQHETRWKKCCISSKRHMKVPKPSFSDNMYQITWWLTKSHTFPDLWLLHRIMHNRRMVFNVLYTAVLYPMHDTLHVPLVLTYVLVVIICRLWYLHSTYCCM